MITKHLTPQDDQTTSASPGYAHAVVLTTPYSETSAETALLLWDWTPAHLHPPHPNSPQPSPCVLIKTRTTTPPGTRAQAQTQTHLLFSLHHKHKHTHIRRHKRAWEHRWVKWTTCPAIWRTSTRLREAHSRCCRVEAAPHGFSAPCPPHPISLLARR